MRKISSSQRGFTILETMVAITLLITAMVAPMTIAARGLQSAFYAREHLTAVYLAQEAMEIMRMHRDNYALSHQGSSADDWYSSYFVGLGNRGSACAGAAGCDVDSRDMSTFIDCTSPLSCRLQYDGDALVGDAVSRGMYTHEITAIGSNSLFTRVVRLAPVAGNNNEIAVTVQVSWQANVFSGMKTVTLRSTLFNHYNAY